MATTTTPVSAAGSAPPPSTLGLSQSKALALEQEVVEFHEQLYEQATSDRDREREVRDTMRAIQYLEGEQWGQKARYARHRPVMNISERHFWEGVGLLTDLSLDFTVKMFDKLNSYSEFEKMLNQLMLHWAMKSGYEDRQYDMILYGLLHTGPAKIQWNSSLNGGLGDNQMLAIAPWQIAAIGAGTDIQEAECVMYFPVVTKQYIERRFGKILASRVEYDMEYSGQLAGQFQRPGRISPEKWSRMSEGLRISLGVQRSRSASESAYPMAMLKEFWRKDDCVAPFTKILTADLRWKPASEIKVGDELIGCDEETSKAVRNQCRWVRKVKVERVAKLVRPSVRIVTDKGVVQCSESHRWLSTPKKSETYSWRFAGELKAGDRIAYTFDPWITDESWGAGYLAGILDGEGWVSKYQVGFAQAEHNASVIQTAVGLLVERGFPINIHTSTKKWRNAKSFNTVVQVVGGRSVCLRLIGSVRPARLLEKSESLWNGKLLKNKGEISAKVLSVEIIGEQEVIAIKTDRQTFIADGFVSHNSTNETSQTVTVGPKDSKGNPLTNWAYRVEPGEKLYPRGRVVAIAGGVALEDSCNPYWHARYPFPMFRPYRVPWRLSGYMKMKSWMQMNGIINRVMGGLLDAIHALIEPTLIAPKGAFPPADWDAIDPGAFGGKIKYNNNAPKAPEFAKRGDFPFAASLEIVREIKKEFDMSSGSSAIQQALGKKQVPGGDSLEMILSSRSLPVRVQSRSLASFIEDGGGMLVSNTLQFYSVQHRVAILGTEGFTHSDFRPIYGEAIPQGMAPEDFVRKFQGVIRRDTMLQSQKENKLAMAYQLLKLGKISDKTFFRLADENFNYDQNRMELLEEAKIKILVAAAAAAAQGKGSAGHGKK